VQLIIEPDDGIAPLLEGIQSAKKSIEIVIFRFDMSEIESALKAAAGRGVFVQALIASTNRGGEERLRTLETRLLAAGITVARTANDLVRYHNKLIIIDRQILYLLGFNYTFLDTGHSRSFGIITKVKKLVAVSAQSCSSAGPSASVEQPGQLGLMPSALMMECAFRRTRESDSRLKTWQWSHT